MNETHPLAGLFQEARRHQALPRDRRVPFVQTKEPLVAALNGFLGWQAEMRFIHPALGKITQAADSFAKVRESLSRAGVTPAEPLLREAAVTHARWAMVTDLTEPEMAVMALSVELLRDLADVVRYGTDLHATDPSRIRLPDFFWLLARQIGRTDDQPHDASMYVELVGQVFATVGIGPDANDGRLGRPLGRRVLDEDHDAEGLRPGLVVLLWLAQRDLLHSLWPLVKQRSTTAHASGAPS